MSTKSLVLSRLENNKGSYISGADLAEEFHVSRNAIWKAINDLKSEGYPIQSVNNKGYSLNPESDIISEEAIQIYLESKKKNSKKCSKSCDVRLYVYDELDSTNTQAKRLLIGNTGSFLHGSIIIAGSQSLGRGHDGSSFASPNGGIYMSIIIEPGRINTGKKSITQFIAEGVREALQDSLDISVEIKNKNRLYQGKKKISGILTEGIQDMETGKFSNYIAGIGILSGDIKTDSKVNRNLLIAEIINRLI